MEYHWLQQKPSATNLIVFFSGWGFNTDIVSEMVAPDDYDVLFVYRYKQIETTLPIDKRYQKTYLVAWSFGVNAYYHWQQKNTFPFDHKIAINGTSSAIDRSTGIPEKVLQKTLEMLSPISLCEFARRCGVALDDAVSDDVDELKNELIEIHSRAKNQSIQANDVYWDKIWISQTDKIFPFNNMLRAWQHQLSQTAVINADHYPFALAEHWQHWLV